PQVCHVVFVKSITFETPTQPRRHAHPGASSSSAAVSNSLKPFPPPTPNLIELPTCPVCLERMDETNGLMTIPCSHVFHCTCLQSWKGAGCPVCRFTNTSSQGSASDPDNPYAQPFGSPVSNLCSVCDCTDDLWICLICGYVGCGRYKGGHAKDHWKETAHSFALELETQHVWDYAGDMWVHRLIRDKGDGKVVELPGRGNHGEHGDGEDVVPRAKLENIGLEYTHLITSQLESQRAYYEEMISKAVDKAAKAAAVAESTATQSSKTMERLADLEEKYKTLSTDTVPQLDRDLQREKGKAAKAEALARNLGKALQEEKRLNEGLMKRIEHLGADNEAVRKELDGLKAESAELKEMNRDLSMFISGQEKLKELEREGKLEEGEVAQSSASVPEKKGRRRPKK
ncbi:RING finger protein ETP1, partial [Tolypocladium capitatum]